MDTSALKAYAPQARRDFIAAVTARAAGLGLHPDRIEPIVEEGDVALIAGRPFPRSVADRRRRLETRVAQTSFDQAMEAMAYTWFNRLMAIRYMELHGYLEHGYRVLSHPAGKATPEILEHAAEVDLPGLDQEEVVELMLDGTKDEELYRQLLLGQCHALHEAMPFLFASIDDETELLLPANLLHTDSLIRQLVEIIDEALWQEIEIIGWLYQFYISEKKDQVIGKVVKPEDIPAATQLFTPNWIVKYMVQNSLGAQWLGTYPESPLKGQMEYYIEPAEQTDEVKAQLAAITPSQLNPEELALIDPASGSGHLLVEAYELFKAIYLERGYRQREVPELILEKNLFGLDIDERAAQLTGFALMMKGRADDRRLFERGMKLNVMALVDSAGFDTEGLAQGVKLADYGVQLGDLAELKRLFEHATTFGSLIQVPEGLAKKLPELKQLSGATSSDMFVAKALELLGPLVQQAELLAARYDAVVANPPYMGSGGMNGLVKTFAKDQFPGANSDLFACFIERGFLMAKDAGQSAMVTMQTWMFLSSFERLRRRLLLTKTITTLAQIGYNSFPSMNSKVAQAAVFSLANRRLNGFTGTFIDLNSAPQSADKRSVFLARDQSNIYTVSPDEFLKIPGSPMAYRASAVVRRVFSERAPLKSAAQPLKGMFTGDNEAFVRFSWEVASIKFGCLDREESRASTERWYPYLKGGDYRKWYGNTVHVVNYYKDGMELRAAGKYGERNPHRYFNRCVTWSDITSLSTFAARYCEPGFLTSSVGCGIFSDDLDLGYISGLLCAKPTSLWLQIINPTLHANPGDLEVVPLCDDQDGLLHGTVQSNSRRCIGSAQTDWDAYERSWDFQSFPLLTASSNLPATLESSYTAWIVQNRDTIAEMKRLEEENNRLFIDAYGLADELTPDVPIEQITLTVNPAYRYGGKLTEEEQWTRFRQDTMEELVSYAIGCMMGRYSLDAPGLIYAHSGGESFDPGRYATFPADDDGIIPITDYAWFEDDAAQRFERFIGTAWPEEHLRENLEFVADALGPKKGESPSETIRRYLGTGFFKQHLQTYKKRPIYWLFSSGKQRAFQCLVYLHRYNEGTLARMRTEYVISLQGKISSRIDQLDGDIAGATSTSHQRKVEKRRDTLVKLRAEVQSFDENLRHYADQRIHLDLDDGVKANYGRFGDLLAEVKAVTGKKPGD